MQLGRSAFFLSTLWPNPKIDYIDLFLIHNPHSGSILRLEAYRALLTARSLGLVRSVGVSNYGIHHLQEIESADLELPSVNQIELHPYCQQRDIVAYCREKKITVQAYCPIMRGKVEEGEAGEVVGVIAEKYGKERAQVLLRWSLQKGFSLPVLFFLRMNSDDEWTGLSPCPNQLPQNASYPTRASTTLSSRMRIWSGSTRWTSRGGRGA